MRQTRQWAFDVISMAPSPMSTTSLRIQTSGVSSHLIPSSSLIIYVWFIFQCTSYIPAVYYLFYDNYFAWSNLVQGYPFSQSRQAALLCVRNGWSASTNNGRWLTWSRFVSFWNWQWSRANSSQSSRLAYDHLTWSTQHELEKLSFTINEDFPRVVIYDWNQTNKTCIDWHMF